MESVDRNKLNGAVRLLRDQRHDSQRTRAKRILQDLELEHAENPRGLMQIGDAWLRGEERAEAGRVFMKAGDEYARQRFYKYAGAMYRNVLDLEPDNHEARLLLAEMLDNEGMCAEADVVRAKAAKRQARAVKTAQRKRRVKRATSAVAAFAAGAMVVLGPISLIEAGWIEVEQVAQKRVSVELQRDQVERVSEWMRGL
jgi:tetratricopeptide (TPR) repeat protein